MISTVGENTEQGERVGNAGMRWEGGEVSTF